MNVLRDDDNDEDEDFHNVSLIRTVPLIIGIVVVLTC